MPEEINKNRLTIKHLPKKVEQKEINPAQAVLDLKIECEREIQGIGMGVLSDGTPFLNQRGLAALCGVMNAHIGTISSEWSDTPPKPRISKIKEILVSRGASVPHPHFELSKGNKPYYAYPDTVCLAILEYYAMDAGANCQPEARRNFRALAGRALHDFIYAQVGYDPNNNLSEAWRVFHDRVSLTYNSVPPGYFSIFKEIADMIVTLGQAGVHIDASFVPDISVGQHWGKHWADGGLSGIYGERKKYDHNYPDYFPQAKSNPQDVWCYPEGALGEFRRWYREHYIGDGKFEKYLLGKVKSRELTASFAQLAISAYKDTEED